MLKDVFRYVKQTRCLNINYPACKAKASETPVSLLKNNTQHNSLHLI